jgi:hypothetical protein
MSDTINIFKILDKDGGGTITLYEFEIIFKLAY